MCLNNGSDPYNSFIKQVSTKNQCLPGTVDTTLNKEAWSSGDYVLVEGGR